MLAANLKAGIHKPSFYDPEVNRSYTGMAAHYEVGILPARPRKPRDTTKVEAGVRFAQSYILGRLRHRAVASAREQWRHVGAQPRGVGALDAEHADVALFQAQQQMRDRGRREIDRGEVDRSARQGARKSPR